MSDFKRLFKHTSIYSVGNIAMRAGAFVLLPLYTHYLTIAEYGILELLYSVSSIISSFLSIGLAHATLRFYFEYDELSDRNAVISSSMITSFIITVPAVLLISIFNRQISNLVFDSPEYVSALNLTYIILVFEMARQIGLSYLRAKEYSISFVVISVAQLIVQVILNIITVAVLHLGIFGILFGNMISVFVGLVICSFITFRECGFRYDWNKMKEIFNYSLPFFFSSISGVILENADRFILKMLLSLDAVGIYALAYKFGLLLKELVVEPFQRSFGAFRFSIMKQSDAKFIQSRTLLYFFAAVAWVGLGLSLLSNEIIYILTAEEYYAAAKYIVIIALAVVISSCGYIFQTGMLYKKKTLWVFYAGLFSDVCGLICSWIFISLWEIWGAVIAFCALNVFRVISTNFLSQKLYPVKYDYNRLFQATFICLCLYSSGYMAMVLITNFYIVFIIKIFLAVLFPFILAQTGYFTKEEIASASMFGEKIKESLKNMILTKATQ